MSSGSEYRGNSSGSSCSSSSSSSRRRGGPAKSANGYVLFVSNINTRATDTSVTETLLDSFSNYGEVSNLTVNLDRKTGFVKGYALLEYHVLEEAKTCIKEMNGKNLEYLICPVGEPLSKLTKISQSVNVDWAYIA